jgi:hypothetical protein
VEGHRVKVASLYQQYQTCTSFSAQPSSLIGAIFVSFDKEFQQVSDNIAHHITEIDWAANAANIEEAKRARGFEEAVRQGNFSLLLLYLVNINRLESCQGSTNAVVCKCLGGDISARKRLHDWFPRLGLRDPRTKIISHIRKP